MHPLGNSFDMGNDFKPRLVCLYVSVCVALCVSSLPEWMAQKGPLKWPTQKA